MRYIEFEFEFDALYPQAGSRSSCESTVPLILKCACEWLYFWLSKIGPSEGTHEKFLACTHSTAPRLGQETHSAPRASCISPRPAFTQLMLIGDGFQFHRNQHREVERVRSYSRDSAVITKELTSFSPILMTLRAEKVVASARSCSLTSIWWC